MELPDFRPESGQNVSLPGPDGCHLQASPLDGLWGHREARILALTPSLWISVSSSREREL